MRRITLFFLIAVLAGNAAAQNVGIGTTTPTATLDVNGSLRIRGGVPAAGKVLTTDASGNTSWMAALKPGFVMSENAADADLIASGYVNNSSVLLNTKTAVSATIPATTWKRASGFLGERGTPAVLSAGSNSYIVFGGYDDDNGNLTDGAIYDAVNDTWTAIPDIGDGIQRSNPLVVWTGTKLIVWGGYVYNGSFTYYNNGYIYNLVTKIWTPMSTVGAPSLRTNFASGYDASENQLAIWGGVSPANAILGDGAKYDVATNTWSLMSATSAPTARTLMSAATNNGQMFLFGGSTTYLPYTYTAQSYSYNFANNTWALLPATPLSARALALVANVNGRYVVWSGTSAAGSSQTDGAVFNTANNSWSTMSTSNVPNPYAGRIAVSNNYYVVVGFNGCGKYDPLTNTWSSLPLEERANHGIAGTSASLFAYGGKNTLMASGVWVKNGSRLFWNAQTVINHLNVLMELYLYKKN